MLDTSAGPITIEFFRDKAPEHVRNFLRLAQSGVYDGTAFHRVVRGFVVQAGALNTRGAADREAADSTCTTCSRSSTTTKHVKGIISMARGDDPASAMTSFFIVTGDAQLARQQVHGIRPGRRRHGGGGGDGPGAGERRDAR